MEKKNKINLIFCLIIISLVIILAALLKIVITTNSLPNASIVMWYIVSILTFIIVIVGIICSWDISNKPFYARLSRYIGVLILIVIEAISLFKVFIEVSPNYNVQKNTFEEAHMLPVIISMLVPFFITFIFILVQTFSKKSIRKITHTFRQTWPKFTKNDANLVISWTLFILILLMCTSTIFLSMYFLGLPWWNTLNGAFIDHFIILVWCILFIIFLIPILGIISFSKFSTVKNLILIVIMVGLFGMSNLLINYYKSYDKLIYITTLMVPHEKLVIPDTMIDQIDNEAVITKKNSKGKAVKSEKPKISKNLVIQKSSKFGNKTEYDQNSEYKPYLTFKTVYDTSVSTYKSTTRESIFNMYNLSNSESVGDFMLGAQYKIYFSKEIGETLKEKGDLRKEFALDLSNLDLKEIEQKRNKAEQSLKEAKQEKNKTKRNEAEQLLEDAKQAERLKNFFNEDISNLSVRADGTNSRETQKTYSDMKFRESIFSIFIWAFGISFIPFINKFASLWNKKDL